MLSGDLSRIPLVIKALGPRQTGSKNDFFFTHNLQDLHKNLIIDLIAFSLSLSLNHLYAAKK